jgi:hypothetical protein
MKKYMNNVTTLKDSVLHHTAGAVFDTVYQSVYFSSYRSMLGKRIVSETIMDAVADVVAAVEFLFTVKAHAQDHD